MAQMLTLGTIWTAPFGLLGVSRSSFSWGPALAIVLLGVIGTGFAFAFMASLVGRVGAPRATFITYIIPVVSLLLGVTLLGDEVTALALLGVGLVMVAAFLASRRER
jgi:drug/metabolite transporter (DMT)-like permease